jgi:hypothetical protein
MSRKSASGQASEAILRFSASAHDGSQKIKDETKKCPRFERAWTLAKTDVRYWQETIFRQTYTRNGETLVTKNWAMKIAHLCRRETTLRPSFYITTIFTSFINSETRVVSWQGGCLGRSV